MIYTIGYTGLKVDQLKKWADDHNAIVVDTRISTRSRNVTWTHNRLTKALGDTYTHVRELGNVNYKGGDILIKDSATGAAKVQAIRNTGKNVVLMCVCKDHTTCHRTHAAAAVQALTDDDITHLTASEVNAYNTPKQNKLF